MTRFFYVHWNRDEANQTVRALRESGHTVILHDSTEQGAGADAWKKIRAHPPDALVISLARLPSHGRRIAAVTAEYKALREVTVIFVDGEPDKVEVARKQFPRARFINSNHLLKALQHLEVAGAGK